jgi:glycerophosphoryl diester phosphodiesterase
LTEEVVLIRELNRAAGREAGIYPEVKHPGWHAANGVDLSARLLEQLERLGYVGPDAPVYVQCFDAGELRRIRTELGTRLRLVQLVNDREIYRELLQPHGLKELAQHATGISPHYRQLVRYTEASGIEPSILAQQTRDAGLLLHPHTFRRARLPVYAPTLEALLDVFLRQIRVHGVFCDYPDVAVRCRDSLAA